MLTLAAGLGLALCATQVKETTRAVTFLHNELFFAAAQKKYVYIYDKRGLEVHCLREHVEPAALEFLPHHFLLASVGEPGKCAAAAYGAASWQDSSSRHGHGTTTSTSCCLTPCPRCSAAVDVSLCCCQQRCA